MKMKALLVPDARWTYYTHNENPSGTLEKYGERLATAYRSSEYSQWHVDIIRPAVQCENHPLSTFKTLHEAMLYLETKIMMGV